MMNDQNGAIRMAVDRFAAMPVAPEHAPKLDRLRLAAKSYQQAIDECCPPSRERSLAETHLETAAMFATKAVTHNQDKL